MAGGKTRRCFFALWPDVELAAKLHATGQAAFATCGGRPMRLDTLHLTLAFLGDIPAARVTEAEKVANEIAGVEPFDISLDRIGYWRHNRILWAGGVSPRLTFLASALGDRLRAANFALDMRPFAAHVTLLRNAECPQPPVLAKPLDWPVSEFVLAESHPAADGAHYDIVGRWPLPPAQVLK